MKDFFAIVRAVLWDEPMPEVEMSDELIRLLMQHGLGPLVFPRLPMTPVMKMVCVQNMQTQAKMQTVLERAWKALEKAGIKTVLMKGAGLAAYYPDPSMRQCGDIDLFVGKEQYHPACAVMRETFPDALKFDEELDHYKHYNLIADGVSIETHRVSVGLTHPRDVRRYAEMERFGMEHAFELKVGDMRLEIFEPTFNALMVFWHSWEHMISSGANIRQLCDLALLLHHEQERIDWKRLEHWLKALNAWDVWQVYMIVLKHNLGLEVSWIEVSGLEVSGLEVRGKRLMEAILYGETFEGTSEMSATRQSKKYHNRFVRKWHTMQVRMDSAKWVSQFSPAYARHLKEAVWLGGLSRLFAKDRHWE